MKLTRLIPFALTFILSCSALNTPAQAQATATKLQIPQLNWEPRTDWANVKALGAIGDGVLDDTAAIQKAFDALKEGETVYLPAGTYRITQTLNFRGPFAGAQLIGNGRDTKIIWDGPAGASMLIVDGIADVRYVGISFDGRNKAGIGLYHHSDRRFETEVRHQYLAFFNLTQAGLATDNNDRFALAETLIENCVFDNCKAGAFFHSFNDYNFTFTGCEFRDCGTGIDSYHGNFYARDCHFENSKVIDMISGGEHNGSVRRCTSVGSQAFLSCSSSVAAVTIQDCRVDSWKSPTGAVIVRGAPVLMFDCVFTNPPGPAAPVKIADGNMQFIASENTAPGSEKVIEPAFPTQVHNVPAGQRKRSGLVATDRFLKETVAISGKVFDVKRDFGAKGDGAADDTKAIQAAIDAARKAGKGAIAYLPHGWYNITSTLDVFGSDYYFGGSGYRTGLVWKGPKDGTMVSVHDTRNVTLEHFNVGSHDFGPMDNAIDILQTGSTTGTDIRYDGVYVYGMYQKDPFRKGIEFRNLGSKDVVLMPHVEGNLRFIDCAQATVLGNATYEGSITVSGKDKRRDGFLGFQTRLATIVTHGLYVRDNQNFVASDFYVEQSNDGMVMEGNPGDPAGRITIQGAKLHIEATQDGAPVGTPLYINNYQGQIFFGPYQFYPGSKPVRFYQRGNRPVDVFLVGVSCYGVIPQQETTEAGKLYSVGTHIIPTDGVQPAIPQYLDGSKPTTSTLKNLTPALDDLRRLGEVDLLLNFPHLGR